MLELVWDFKYLSCLCVCVSKTIISLYLTLSLILYSLFKSHLDTVFHTHICFFINGQLHYSFYYIRNVPKSNRILSKRNFADNGTRRLCVRDTLGAQLVPHVIHSAPWLENEKA